MHRTPPDTAKRHKGKKSALGTSSTSRTPLTSSDTELEEQQHEFESPLGEFVDQTPRAHKPAHQTPTMAEETAQAEIRRLRAQLAQAETTILDLSQSANPDEDRDRPSEIELQQQENREARQHELEMAKLQLQIEQAKAANTTPAAINITQREDKVTSFKKEVAAKSLKTSFKLEGSTNYESWRDEALTQALAIEAKHILMNKETTCPAGITDDDEKKIWEVKSKALFDILLAGVKPAIRQIIKTRINEDNKNATELWTAIEAEYRIHAADTRMELMHRFATATIEDNNVQQYISQFRDTCGKLKQMGFEIPQWQQNDRFIDGLKGYQAAFVQAKRDDSKDPKNKGNITELDLNELMDQLIARAVDHKDRQKPAQALKAEDKPNEEPDNLTSLTSRGGSTLRQSSTRGSKQGRGGHTNQQGWIKCGYCGRSWHEEEDCKMKNYANQSQEWQTINASAIEYFKKKNEGRTTDLKPAAGSTPTTPATPSTPTPMANPNVGYSAMAFSATNPIRAIPKTVGANILIPDPIRDIPKAVGATNKEETTGLPRPRRGRLKQQSLVDPVVLSAQKLTNWQIEPDINGTDSSEED
jgi:gag-polypeptide of LTR copia-type